MRLYTGVNAAGVRAFLSGSILIAKLLSPRNGIVNAPVLGNTLSALVDLLSSLILKLQNLLQIYRFNQYTWRC